MDVPGCDDGSLVVVVGWASFLVFRVFLVGVPACDYGSLVVLRVFLVTAISQSVILSGNPLQSIGLSLRSTIFKLGSCSFDTEKVYLRQ